MFLLVVMYRRGEFFVFDFLGTKGPFFFSVAFLPAKYEKFCPRSMKYSMRQWTFQWKNRWDAATLFVVNSHYELFQRVTQSSCWLLTVWQRSFTSVFKNETYITTDTSVLVPLQLALASSCTTFQWNKWYYYGRNLEWRSNVWQPCKNAMHIPFLLHAPI